MMTQRWIVTGANGYLGGETCKGLADRGLEVYAVARTGRPMQELEQAGIACHTYEDLGEILVEGDVMVHCAGKVGNVGEWDEFARVNVDWTMRLFQQAAERGASCFVYVSSVAALGYMNRRSGEMLDEEAVPLLCAGELYGRSKWLAEQALQKYSASARTRLIVLRPGLVYGRRSFAMPQTWLRRGFVVDPGQRVPLVHIDSFLDAVVKIVHNTDTNTTFVVVDEEQPSLDELNAMRIHHGMLRYHPWRVGKTGYWLLIACRHVVSTLRGHPGAVPKGYAWAQYCFATRRLRYSTKKLRAMTGWMPKIDLTQGLRSCCPISKANSDREEECLPSKV
jgi:nucleoside-diphosphate-sugar epimerase